MPQWFVRFSEFAEFIESYAPKMKNSIAFVSVQL